MNGKIFTLYQHESCRDCLQCKLVVNDEYINNRMNYLAELFMCDANIFIEIMSIFIKRSGIKLFHCNCDKLAIALGNIVFKTVYSPAPLMCEQCNQVDCRCVKTEYYGFRLNSELATYAYMTLKEFNELEVDILKALNFDVSIPCELCVSQTLTFSNMNTSSVPNDIECHESMDVDLL